LRRQCQLLSALDTEGSGQFAESRKLLDEERARFAQLADKERSTRVARYDIAVRVVFGLIDVFVAWLAVFLSLAAATRPSPVTRAMRAMMVVESLEHTKARDGVVERWKAPFAAFAGAGILTAMATLSGGISVDDKLWIGADSWVVSRPLWFCNLVSMSAIVIAFARR